MKILANSLVEKNINSVVFVFFGSIGEEDNYELRKWVQFWYEYECVCWQCPKP